MHDEQSKEKNKPVLIIPAAGKSSRYPNMKPKWMLTHPCGKLMIEKVMDGLNLNDYSSIYFVILKEHCEKYESDFVLKQAFQGDKFHIVILDSSTKSSPETVKNCLIEKNITGPIIVKDCDCLVKYKTPNKTNFAVGLDLTKNKNIKNIQQKSFIIANNHNIIQEIIEKKIVSDKICLGVYGMDSSDMLESFDKLSKTLISEIYFSDIISDIIDKKSKSFLMVEADDYVDWGTQEEWFSSSNMKKTYFFDIDGILLSNTGKYGSKNWYNTIQPIEENLKILKKLSDSGNEIIFVTSRPKNALKMFIDLLEERKISYKTIIDSCLHSKRIIINDFAPSNPFPSCLAINIPRNTNIEPYLT